jgi:(p)ppGpp synthase/HD superfamily hydrolase
MEKETLEYFMNVKNVFYRREHDDIRSILQKVYDIHKGIRKDGKTPEIMHQLQIIEYLLTIYDINRVDANLLFSVAALHDTKEDYPIEYEKILRTLICSYDSRIIKCVNTLTKTGKDIYTYYDEISTCPICALVKGADRIHNNNSIKGVFSSEKIKEYKEEGIKYVLRMLYRARALFPNYKLMFDNEIMILDIQLFDTCVS